MEIAVSGSMGPISWRAQREARQQYISTNFPPRKIEKRSWLQGHVRFFTYAYNTPAFEMLVRESDAGI